MVVAQALVEYGALNSIAAGFASARYRIELLIGPGNSKYLLFAVCAVVIFLLVKRRRAR